MVKKELLFRFASHHIKTGTHNDIIDVVTKAMSRLLGIM